MPEASGVRHSTKSVHSLDGDETVLCAVIATEGKVVIVVNTRYPDALAHAEAHLAHGLDCVFICTPDCSG